MTEGGRSLPQLLGPATLSLPPSLRTASTSLCWRSPGHSTVSAVTEGIRLTVGLALRSPDVNVLAFVAMRLTLRRF